MGRAVVYRRRYRLLRKERLRNTPIPQDLNLTRLLVPVCTTSSESGRITVFGALRRISKRAVFKSAVCTCLTYTLPQLRGLVEIPLSPVPVSVQVCWTNWGQTEDQMPIIARGLLPLHSSSVVLHSNASIHVSTSGHSFHDSDVPLSGHALWATWFQDAWGEASVWRPGVCLSRVWADWCAPSAWRLSIVR